MAASIPPPLIMQECLLTKHIHVDGSFAESDVEIPIP